MVCSCTCRSVTSAQKSRSTQMQLPGLEVLRLLVPPDRLLRRQARDAGHGVLQPPQHPSGVRRLTGRAAPVTQGVDAERSGGCAAGCSGNPPPTRSRCNQDPDQMCPGSSMHLCRDRFWPSPWSPYMISSGFVALATPAVSTASILPREYVLSIGYKQASLNPYLNRKEGGKGGGGGRGRGDLVGGAGGSVLACKPPLPPPAGVGPRPSDRRRARLRHQCSALQPGAAPERCIITLDSKGVQVQAHLSPASHHHGSVLRCCQLRLDRSCGGSGARHNAPYAGDRGAQESSAVDGASRLP